MHNTQLRIEEAEEMLQAGCEESLAAAQDALRLRLELIGTAGEGVRGFRWH